MQFESLLFNQEDRPKPLPSDTQLYKDLNLDLIIDDVTSCKKECDFKIFFYAPLREIDIIRYRQDIFKDLENNEFFLLVENFSKKISEVEKYQIMIEKQDDNEYKKISFLQMASIYIEAMMFFEQAIESFSLHSEGFILFRDYIIKYTHSEKFKTLYEEANILKEKLNLIQYNITIKGLKFKVSKYDNEEDYSKKVENIFKKFEHDGAKDCHCQFEKNQGINHINAKILEFVGKLFPEEFLMLDKFCDKHINFIDEKFRKFSIETQFYLSYIKYITKIKEAALPFCYPKICKGDKEIFVENGYDLALAYNFSLEKKIVIKNSFHLNKKERIIVVSGANQGGKTTFARMFAQIHYLASLGLPIPASKAKLFLADHFFTHFEREEHVENLRSKLQDDLMRIHEILSIASTNSIIILNEIFSSTSLEDSLFLSKKIMDKIVALDALGVWVTFVDELSDMHEKTVSMICDMNYEDVTNRTYKIIRHPADGLAYAISIAKKYHLSFKQIMQRIEK